MARRPIFLHLSLMTRRDRHRATDDAANAVAAAGGWVDDYQQFSNKMTTLRVTVPAKGLHALRDHLSDRGLALADTAILDLDHLANDPAMMEGDREVSATLQMTFIHGEPDLRVDIPAVPG